MAGCKCPGSCACKIKKPRKPKALKKAVLGGRVKQPQVIIQGMPAVSTTAIPQGYPYLTVTSDAAAKRSMTTQTETQTQAEVKKEVKQEVKEEPLRELKGESLSLFLPTQTPSQQLSLLKSKITAGTTKKFPPVASQQAVLRATTGTQAGPSTATTGTQSGPSLTTTEVQTEAPTRMTTAAQTNLIEHVGVGTQFGPSLTSAMTQTSLKVRSPEEIAAIAKEQKEAGIVEGYRMGRAREALRQKETREPILVNVAKGRQEDIFNLIKEQQATGKIFSLTKAGRPTRPFNESLGLAYPSPSPSPVRVAPVGSVPATAPPAVGSASSSEGVPGYTVISKPSSGITTYGVNYPSKAGQQVGYIAKGGRVVQMPPEVIDLS